MRRYTFFGDKGTVHVDANDMNEALTKILGNDDFNYWPVMDVTVVYTVSDKKYLGRISSIPIED